MTMPRAPRQNNKPSPGQKALTKRLRERRMMKLKVPPDSHLARRTVTDPLTGTEYPSRAAMLAARKAADTRLLRDFISLVNEGNLPQDPWAQLPSEPPVQFERFRHYLSLAPRVRSVAATARWAGIGSRRLDVISSRWHWVLRAKCWDRHLDELEEEAFREAKRVAVRRQARLGSRLQDLAEVGVRNMLAVGGADLTAADISRLADTGVKIERLAHDKSTSNEARRTETVLVWEGPTPKWAPSIALPEPAPTPETETETEIEKGKGGK